MKNIMNYSKLAIATLITSSLFVACSEEISETTCNTQYTANTGNLKSAGQAVDLGLPSGTKWANMNVGATSESDNGVLFVWGDVTGTQLLANSSTTYTDVTDPTSMSTLFNMYKGAEEAGAICDTTNIAKIAEPGLIDLSGVDDAQKKDAIVSFVKDKLTNLSKSYEGFLEATLVNDEFECIIDWDGSKFIERYPVKEDALADFFNTFDYTKTTNLVIDKIGTTETKYAVSPLANNYTEIKDQFDAVMRKDYAGGDIGNDVKDRHDDKKKNNLNFVPVYSIISDAKHDPATANWGNNWRMPSTADFVELLEYCNWEFTGSGYKVSSKVNGNSIFLPAAGYRYGEELY